MRISLVEDVGPIASAMAQLVCDQLCSKERKTMSWKWCSGVILEALKTTFAKQGQMNIETQSINC